MKSLIVDSRLYFPSASSFNDPLDCRIPPSFEGSKLAIESYWRRSAHESIPAAPKRDRKREIAKMVLACKTRDGQARLTKRFFSSIDKHGVLCLSKDPTNMLLWSYYADGHSGIAVQFNTTARSLYALGRIASYFPVEVNYSQEFPDYSYYKSSDLEFVHHVVGTKARAWEHEQEWRIVLVDRVGHLTLPPGMIDGVVLGVRTSPEAEAAVRSWVQERSSLKLLRVVHKPRSFELALEPA